MDPMKGLSLSPEIEAMILAQGVAAGAAATEAAAAKKVAKKAGGAVGASAQRLRLVAAAWDAANAGKLPPAPQFPTSNYWSQRKADALLDLTKAGDADGVASYGIGGTNTYSRALRSYRDACLHYLSQHATKKDAA